MFISVVDRALQDFLMEQLQFPAGTSGAVSFEAPTPDWATARGGVPTVNLFLQRVERSSAIARTAQRRFDANGRPDRRVSSATMIDLGFVVTVWADDAATEHDLLGQVVSVFAATPTLPAAVVPPGLTSPVAVTFGSEDAASGAPFAVAGPMKAYAVITVAVAADLDRQEDGAAVALP